MRVQALTRFWRRMVEKIIRETPGIGNMDEAKAAVKRSESAVRSVRWHKAKSANDIEYVQSSIDANHFRERVIALWTDAPRRQH